MRDGEDEYLTDMVNTIEKYDKTSNLSSIKTDIANIKYKSEDEIKEIYKNISSNINSLEDSIKDSVRMTIKIIQQHKYSVLK